MTLPIIMCYSVELEPGHAELVAYCLVCARRETRPHALHRAGMDRAAWLPVCEGCGLGATGPIQTLTVAQILDDLVTVVDRSRTLLRDQPDWIDDLDDAYDWLLAYDGELVTDGHVVLLPSDSEPGKLYSVNGACQCGAYHHRSGGRRDRACKHRVRAKLIKRALEARAQQIAADAESLRRRLIEARYERSLAEINELFPS